MCRTIEVPIDQPGGVPPAHCRYGLVICTAERRSASRRFAASLIPKLF